MGKRLKLLIFFWTFLVVSLWANATFETQIKAFDNNFPRASSEEMLKMHHMLKNIYIQSIIQNDSKLKAQALERLIKSANALSLDSKPYESELSTLQARNPSLSVPKKSVSEEKEPPKPKPTPVGQSKANEPKPDPVQQSTTSAPLAVLSVQFDGDGIKLRYNQPISSKDIKSFILKSKNVLRYVFDIPGALMGDSRTYDSALVDQVRVAQYNKKTIRVVFSHNKPLKLEYQIDNKMLYIGSSITPSSANTKPQSYSKATISNGRKFNPNEKTIVIDPGHGGKDPGAVNGKYQEKKAVLAVALKLGSELKKRGYKVYYTRSNDKYLQLRSRTRVANDKNADLFISIHANAAPAKSKYKSMYGLETFFLSPARSERSKNVAALENKSEVDEMNHFSKQTYLNFLNREKIIASNKFALDVHQGIFDSLNGHYKVRDGGVREAPFWVLVGAQMPAILLEIGYITNPTELKRMFSTTYQQKIANGIADGVDNYFQKNL